MDQQQQSRRRPTRTQVAWIVIGVVAVLFVAVVVFGGYYFEWKWTGYPKRTPWDWVDLLIVPIVLALGGYVFARSENRRTQRIAEQQREVDREIAQQRSQDDILQAYLDQMGQLLIDKERPLHRAQVGDGLSTVARARTLSVLRRLDGERKGDVVQFLCEANLIAKEHLIVVIEGADLREAALHYAGLNGTYLSGIDLSSAVLFRSFLNNADLSTTDLRRADLRSSMMSSADLYKADLSEADLTRAILMKADLRRTDLSGANLEGAVLIEADLSGADLSGATLIGARLGGTNLGDADLSDANRWSD